MKVLILSTYEKTGGAAIAAGRLLHALQKNGVEAKMLCMKGKHPWTFLMERLAVLVGSGFDKKTLWTKDLGLFGQDITKTKEYKEADIIHLHWVNQGFISLKGIERFLKDGKKIVWTMHDEWPLEGVLHYTDTDADVDWLSRWVLQRKEQLYKNRDITFVTCSNWLKNLSEKKPLARGQKIISVPNPIDTELFKPVKHENRRRVLFVAQKVSDERKGIKYLNEAASLLKDVEIVALGRDIPYINDIRKMAELYAGFDCFVTPSLQDNLPNTIMEAMACGVPCVGFNVGGIPEMIDHKENGYVAEYRNAEDLARGIEYVLLEERYEGLSKAAREKVLNCYSEETVARKYQEVYEGVL